MNPPPLSINNIAYGWLQLPALNVLNDVHRRYIRVHTYHNTVKLSTSRIHLTRRRKSGPYFSTTIVWLYPNTRDIGSGCFSYMLLRQNSNTNYCGQPFMSRWCKYLGLWSLKFFTQIITTYKSIFHVVVVTKELHANDPVFLNPANRGQDKVLSMEVHSQWWHKKACNREVCGTTATNEIWYGYLLLIPSCSLAFKAYAWNLSQHFCVFKKKIFIPISTLFVSHWRMSVG